MKLEKMEKTAQLPSGVSATWQDRVLTLKGPKGELSREFPAKKIDMQINADSIVVRATNVTKKEKMMLGTYTAHVKNMVTGVEEGYTYKMKVCASHFPMTVAVDGNKLVVKNFLGEAVPRVVKLKEGAKVTVNGQEIVIEATNKELAGQVAADIENKMKRPGFDNRIFQDGIYITEKAGKPVA